MDSEYFSHGRPEIVAVVAGNARRILDVGCGAGQVGASIKSRQEAYVVGIEKAPQAASSAAEILDEVICASIDVATLRDHPSLAAGFDSIICADILEHLEDPWNVLKWLTGLLHPGGSIIMSIPNVANLRILADAAESRWRYEDSGILDRTHLRFFSVEGIRGLLHEAGLKAQMIRPLVDTAIRWDNESRGQLDFGLGRILIRATSSLERSRLTALQFLVVAQVAEAPVWDCVLIGPDLRGVQEQLRRRWTGLKSQVDRFAVVQRISNGHAELQDPIAELPIELQTHGGGVRRVAVRPKAGQQDVTSTELAAVVRGVLRGATEHDLVLFGELSDAPCFPLTLIAEATAESPVDLKASDAVDNQARGASGAACRIRDLEQLLEPAFRQRDLPRVVEVVDGAEPASATEDHRSKLVESTAPQDGASSSAAECRGTAKTPHRYKVSIIIPLFNHVDLTLRCLMALTKTLSPELDFEVILVDNASSDGTRALLAGLEGDVQILRNVRNQGFGPACNQGAAVASGEYLCFLNNDTEPQMGWLDPLLEALDEDPHRGAVQPRLLFPDGRLGDAGGLVFANGEAWVYGKGHPFPDAPEFACRRAPDYLSGACVVVRAAAFRQVGGFDDLYAPAYYEDTDLSFALRAAGWTLLYEPTSTVMHIEGATAGTDTTDGFKAFQVRNQLRFAAKWATELIRRPRLSPDIVDKWAHRAQGGFGPGESYPSCDRALAQLAAWKRENAARRIAVFDLYMPMHDRASGSLRLFRLLEALREAGHHVTLYALSGGDRRYAQDIGRKGIVCYGQDPGNIPSDDKRRDQHLNIFAPALGSLASRHNFDTIVATPWVTAEFVISELRDILPNATFIVDTNDVHWVREERTAAVWGRDADWSSVRKNRSREESVYQKVDRVVCVTREDAAAVHKSTGVWPVVVPNVHYPVDPGPGFDSREGLIFIGNFNHHPNLDALSWWIEEILPPLQDLLPSVRLHVVGNDPLGAAQALSCPGVKVVGYVPQLLPYIHRARLSVAPLRTGAGMKGKVGESLAAGLPSVITPLAAEGLGLIHEQHALVASHATAFAAETARAYHDRELWERLRFAGSEHILKHFGPQKMRSSLSELLATPAAARLSPGAG